MLIRILLVLVLSVWAVPQALAMQHYTDSLFDRQGNAIPAATVHVYTAGTTTHATIYSDNGITPKANPFTTAADGSYHFYAPNGRYDLAFSRTGYTFTAANTVGLVLFDQYDGASWPDGVRQVFNPNATTPGINIGSLFGQPSALSDGDMWFDASLGKFRCQENSVTLNCIGSGAVGGGTFTSLGSGTNTTSAFVCDTGCSLLPTSGGQLAATQLRPTVVTVNAGNSPYTALVSDSVLLCDTTAGARTINLVPATNRLTLTVKNLGANLCTVTRVGADLIDGQPSAILHNQFEAFSLAGDGSATWSVY